MATIEQRLTKLEAAVKKITRPFRLIRARCDLPEIEARALLAIDSKALEADGFNVICTVPAAWRFSKPKTD